MKTELVATRVIPILGDPVAQVATPRLWNALFSQTGMDAVCVPIDLPFEGLAPFLDVVRRARNLPGFLTTVPHKAALAGLCDRVEPDAKILGAVNTVRLEADGTLVGEMFDGFGMMDAIEATGTAISGARIALCGAGAAGSAIAVQAIRRGAAALTVHDADAARASALVAQLAGIGTTTLRVGLPASAGIVINASPAGSPGTEAPPFDPALVAGAVCVADALTDPAETALIAQARATGCKVVQGAEMAAHQGARMRAFLGL